MKKATYLEKLAATKVTDDMTVAEAKAAERTKKALLRFWAKEARAYVEKTEGIDLAAIEANWHRITVDADVKVAGTVAVNVFAADQYQADKLVKTYRVKKADLLK